MKLSILILPVICMLLAFAWAVGQERTDTVRALITEDNMTLRIPIAIDTTDAIDFIVDILRQWLQQQATERRQSRQELRAILHECRRTNVVLDTLRKFIDENCKPANGAISELEMRKMILIRDSTGVKP